MSNNIDLTTEYILITSTRQGMDIHVLHIMCQRDKTTLLWTQFHSLFEARSEMKYAS